MSFKIGQRVLVKECGLEGEIVLNPPAYGFVRRLRMADHGAWIELDDRGPDAIHPFPVDDPRARHVVSFPECCGNRKG